jgi:glycosyltransferase involved in cell wall biosynthesis
MSTIYYFCPDFPQPSAGTKRLYRHVYHLNRRGYNAVIAHQTRGFELTWHEYRVPVVWIEDKLNIRPDDVLVYPEGLARLMQQTRDLPCRRVVIALNWAYIHRNLPKGETWLDYGINQALTPSPLIKSFLEWSMGLEVTLVGNYLDTKRYLYDPTIKRPKISYMARKDLSGDILHAVFNQRSRAATFSWKWKRLEDLDEHEYARHLMESLIFLATSTQEGMPTSILEAMASGCLVVGFAGVGGNDYLIGSGSDQNCILIENGNVPSFGRALDYVLKAMERDKGCYDRIIQNGIKTAGRFQDFNEEGESLAEFFKALGCFPVRQSNTSVLDFAQTM